MSGTRKELLLLGGTVLLIGAVFLWAMWDHDAYQKHSLARQKERCALMVSEGLAAETKWSEEFRCLYRNSPSEMWRKM